MQGTARYYPCVCTPHHPYEGRVLSSKRPFYAVIGILPEIRVGLSGGYGIAVDTYVEFRPTGEDAKGRGEGGPSSMM